MPGIYFTSRRKKYQHDLSASCIMTPKPANLSPRDGQFFVHEYPLDRLTSSIRPVEDHPPEEKIRVVPEDWYHFRATHDFRFPCCLCVRGSPMESYTETEVCVETTGNYVGQYVAACAENKCGYISEFPCKSSQ